MWISTSLPGKIENSDEAISYQNPEIATQPTAARNDGYL
ncbi:hypothetical protein APHACPA_0072 [Rickettsia amblyommatis str. Ac/Pa]|uniref:Uncharacterized protein n=1 Tax=Rickettsia amblyommatis str. Ac/Pa TaxID=1359164 RepID=A0A0F3N076_RICAM|nr:hypothetical protein APHACPA_0072 [Rickettsia amblyommatis str. Ac/Pa]